MADALLGQLFQNLESLIGAEFRLLWGVEEDLKKLSRTLSAIRLVVDDAERKQSTDKMIDLWLRELKDAAYDADDVLDLWSTEVQLSQREFSSDDNCIKQVSGSFLACFPFNQVVFRHKIAKKIAKARDQFEDIFKEMSNLKLVTISTGGGGERGVASLDPTRETTSSIYEQVYGRDGDKAKIADMLIGNANSNQNSVSFLAILGIGGLGKTTLAQYVYNYERVSKHFEVRIWICVSDDFSVQRLTRLIVESLSGKSPDIEALEALQNKMKELLSGKRFLLVLDDVWNDDQNEWNKLKAFLTTCGAKGSSIVVTTRLDGVASIMKEYPLRPLSGKECWSLFEARALGVGEEELPRDILEIGKQIVNKCRGVPLAVKVLGGLLRTKREVREWESIRDSDLWELPEKKEGDIIGVLRLSYNHLRPQLKQCFSYCSIFPKDHKMDKEELIQMWMANGFLTQSIGSRMELEDIGNQSFDELLQGSFFQDVEKDKFGEIESCKMHDLMHDVACHVSDGKCCTLEVGKETKTPTGKRHLKLTGSLQESSSSSFRSVCRSNKSLRTLALPKYSGKRSLDIIMKSKLNYLRVLNLSKSWIEHLPTSVGHMKCLRYLNLSGMSSLKVLPKSICRLIHLQTLKLKGCYELEKLAEEMKSMRQLRHLDIRGCFRLREMPSEMGQMTSLRTLSIFVVGQETGRRINELKGLKHLGGELELRRLDLVEDATEAKEANLVSKRNLLSLELSWGDILGRLQENNSASKEEKKIAEEVLEWLQPHSDVKELIIKGYPGGGRFPSWFKSLTNLVSLELRRFVGIETLPPLGQLSRLKFLTINGMLSLKYIGIEFYGEGGGERELFPALEYFSLVDMPDLARWEGRQREFPNLEKFEIRDCPKLEAFPMLTNWVKLQTMKLSDTMVLSSFIGLNLRLTALEITGLESSSFPEGCLQNLTALKSLNIGYCGNLESIPDEIGNLTALTRLEIKECHELKSIPDEIGNLTALTSLQIEKCDGLISLPAEGLQKLTSLNLTSLIIYRCGSLKSLPEMGIHGANNSLVTLCIRYCRGLTSLSGEPLRYLSSLQTLYIGSCDNLELSNEAFQHLVSLRDLSLWSLPKMTSVPDVQNLTALQSLDILDCRNVRRLPQGLQHLSSLQTLSIGDSDNLELSNEAFQHLVSLRDLTLRYLPKMTSVPDVQNLTALQSLHIEDCLNVRRLPQGLQHLTSLQYLNVEDCHPDLHKRMEKGKGEDWPMISHIPELYNKLSIDGT